MSINFLDDHLIMNTDTTLLQQQQQQQQISFPVSFFMFVNIPNTKNYEFHLQDYYVKYTGDGDGDGVDGAPSSSSSSHKVISRPLNETILLTVDDEGKCKWKGKGNGNSSVEWLVIGSINGLICFYGNETSDCYDIAPSFSICNPITREYLNNLPSLGIIMEDDDRGIAIGFGYHPSTNEYKIVRIIHRVTSHGNYCVRWVQIYTLGSGKWRIRKETGQTGFSGTGVYIDRAIYWLDSLGKIVSFDLEDEKFRMIPTPTTCIGYELGELAGEGLCAIERSNVSTNIYIMSNNNNKDRKYSWSKKFTIPVMGASQYKPIAVTRRGRVLCLCDKRSLVSFDPRTETIESLGDVPWFEGWSPIVSYTKSFVSLKSLGEEDAKIIERRAAKKKRTIDMKTEMIKLFTSLSQNWFVD